MGLSLEELMSRAKSGEYERHGTLDEADCVVGFAFGCLVDGTIVRPGLSNVGLAKFIAVSCSGLPVIAQFELADALEEVAGATPNGAERVYRIERHRNKGEYLDTREVALQAQAIMRQHGWTQPAIVAHPGHMPRVDAICRMIGMNTIAPDGLEVVEFDPDSTQEWTRSAAAWGPHEVVAIPNARKRGWL